MVDHSRKYRDRKRRIRSLPENRDGMTVGKTKTSIPEEILCKVTDRTADRIQERIEADRK